MDIGLNTLNTLSVIVACVVSVYQSTAAVKNIKSALTVEQKRKVNNMELIDKKAALKAIYLAGELINKYGGRFYEANFTDVKARMRLLKICLP